MVDKPTLRLLALAALLAASGCASSNYLAKVNEQPITGKDLKDEFTKRHGGHGSFLASETETRKFLDLVVDQRLLVQEAYRLDLAEQPAIRKAVADYTEKKGAEYFAKVEIDEKGKPTPEEIRAAWEERTTLMYRARQIVTDTRVEAEAVYQQLLTGIDFETIARTCSIAGSRIYGGNLPFLGWGALDPRWEDVVFGMTPGEISAPFETTDGWEIVELQEIQVGERPAFEKAVRRVEGILRKRKLDARKREVSEALWKKYHVKRSEVDLGPEGLHAALTRTPNAQFVTWDGASLSFQEFARQVDWTQIAGYLPGRFRAEIEEQLRRIVNEPLARLEAKERHYEKIPEVAEAVRRYQEDLMERALYADFILKNVSVSEEELKAWYDGHKASFVEPEKRRIAHIVVPTKEEALEIRKAIADGQPFEMLVKTKSTDTSSQKQMGDLGWVTKREATGEFVKVFSLAEGEISEPLPSKFGYHIMRVMKISPERPLDFEEAKESIRKLVLEKKQRDARAVWVKKLRSASTVTISQRGIRAFVKSNSAEAVPAAPSHEAPASTESARKEKS